MKRMNITNRVTRSRNGKFEAFAGRSRSSWVNWSMDNGHGMTWPLFSSLVVQQQRSTWPNPPPGAEQRKKQNMSLPVIYTYPAPGRQLMPCEDVAVAFLPRGKDRFGKCLHVARNIPRRVKTRKQCTRVLKLVSFQSGNQSTIYDFNIRVAPSPSRVRKYSDAQDVY